MSPNRATRLVTTGLTLVWLAAVFGCRQEPLTTSGENPVKPGVRVVAAQQREMTRRVSAFGRCEALPDRLATLTALVEGRVASILVTQGQSVTAGQPIVQLDTTVPEADLAEKQAACDSLLASLRLLQSLPRPEEQQTARLAIEDARIAVARAQSIVDHLRPLLSRREVSDQQMFEAEQALAQARVQQQAAESDLQVMMLGPRAEAVAEAQAKIQVAEKALSSSQAQLQLHTITAPIDGVLEQLDCHPGQTVTTGTVIGQVVDTRRLLAAAWLPDRLWRQVSVGQAAWIETSTAETADPSLGGESSHLPGEVVFVGRMVDTQTGNLPVRMGIDNAKYELAVGQIVNVSIAVSPPVGVLAVPLSAIHDEGEGQSLTVVRNGKAVVLKPQFGSTDHGWIEVPGTDLQVGEPVIVEGAYNLPDGTEVTTSAASTDEL